MGGYGMNGMQNQMQQMNMGMQQQQRQPQQQTGSTLNGNLWN